MKLNNIVQYIGAVILLSIIYWIVQSLLGMTTAPPTIWHFLSNLLVVMVLVALMNASPLRGVRLSILVFLVYFIIGHFNILIEAYVFNILERSSTLLEITRGAMVAMIFSPLIVLIFKKWDAPTTILNGYNHTWWGWLWRVLLVIVAYLFFYIAAGMLIQATIPNFMDYYGDKIPPLPLVFFVQLFRGALFAFIAILILQVTRLKFLHQALLIGFLFVVLGGIAPLIVPNDLMPQYIRVAHGLEVGFSNFLFGVLTAYILRKKKPIIAGQQQVYAK